MTNTFEPWTTTLNIRLSASIWKSELWPPEHGPMAARLLTADYDRFAILREGH